MLVEVCIYALSITKSVCLSNGFGSILQLCFTHGDTEVERGKKTVDTLHDKSNSYARSKIFILPVPSTDLNTTSISVQLKAVNSSKPCPLKIKTIFLFDQSNSENTREKLMHKYHQRMWHLFISYIQTE